jgi:hypothetical protein
MNDKQLVLDVMSVQHKEWLTNPVTVHVIKRINELKEHHISVLSINATNKDMPTEFFRSAAYGINTIQTILTLISSTEDFVNKK